MVVTVNQEKTKLEENLLNMRKKAQKENKNMNNVLNETEIYRVIEKKDRIILELKAKFELKEK